LSKLDAYFDKINQVGYKNGFHWKNVPPHHYWIEFKIYDEDEAPLEKRRKKNIDSKEIK